MPRTRDSGFLRQIISTVASSLEPEEVLRSVVKLLSDASAVHACFVYLVDPTGQRLVLEAASAPYDGLVGSIVLERGEGLAWWSIENAEPAFVPERALDDPRVKYVPELDEEHFQSLLAVPILTRDRVGIGAILVHTEAPREFTQEEVDFLVSAASLVAGAIENARLYAETRRRLQELEGLTSLAEEIAAAETLDELVPAVAAGTRRLLDADAVHVYLLDAAREELVLERSDPASAGARETIGLAELGQRPGRRARASQVRVQLVAGDELVGLLVADGASDVELARAAANQAAVGVKKVQLIERLTERNRIKDFFEELERGRSGLDLEGRAASLGLDLDRQHVVLIAEPPDDALERALAALAPGSVFDRRESSTRALLRVPVAGVGRLVADIRAAHTRTAPGVAVGLSSACTGLASLADGFGEARQAVLGTTVVAQSPSVLSFEDLGPYKYLLRIAGEGTHRDATVEAVSRLVAYDRERNAALLQTLEEFLRRRGSIGATSEALFVHPNTLRQRLRRIADVSGLDLRKDDWLMIEIAVKLVKLQAASSGADLHTSER